MEQVTVGRVGVRVHDGLPAFDTAAFWRALNVERLRRERDFWASGGGRDRRYSWSRIARESGVSIATVTKLEGGASAPSADVLVRLMLWLGSRDLSPFITYPPSVVLPDPMPVEHDPVGVPPST